MSFEVNHDHIEKAYLLTVQWMVDFEYKYHISFKTIQNGYGSNKGQFQAHFYDFTKKYSVRRTLRGSGQKTSTKLLDLLMDSFVPQVIQGDESIIDDFNSEHEDSLLSLLSKFATLINPLSYTMYDGNAKDSLKGIMGRNGIYTNYSKFWNDFREYKDDLLTGLDDENTTFWLNILYNRFGMDKKICTKEVFLHRFADKYLWVMKNEKP